MKVFACIGIGRVFPRINETHKDRVCWKFLKTHEKTTQIREANEQTNKRIGQKKNTRPQKWNTEKKVNVTLSTDGRTPLEWQNWISLQLASEWEWKILYFNLYIRWTNNECDRRNCHQLDILIVHSAGRWHRNIYIIYCAANVRIKAMEFEIIWQ